MKDDANDAVFRIAIVLIGIAVSGLLFGALLVFLFEKTSWYRPSNLNLRHRLLVAGFFLASGFILILLARSFSFHPKILKLVSLWCMSGALGLITLPIWNRGLRNKTITTADLNSVWSRPKIAPPSTESKAFIGQSMLTHRDVLLDEHERAMHVLVSGSTGSGKTTVLKSLYLDAIQKKQPVLIIDPKGNTETVNELKSIMLKCGRDLKAFLTFSIMNPSGSAHYNPLSRGTAMQIRDRIMGAFEWSEPFYKSQASAWLSNIIDILRALQMPVTIRRLRRLLSEPKELEGLQDKISNLDDKIRAKDLLQRLKSAAKGSKENLDGLLSQLRDLDNLEFGNLFEPNTDSQELDLESIIRGNDVAYFQLNTMAYEAAAKTIGRLILQDLKALASQIHGGQITMPKKFFPIFVDEFGSFAFEGFVDFLKMARDVKFANHLFFQSLADLDRVSPEFKAQVQQNCLTKIILRTDDPAEVDFWSGVAGTIDTVESSYQVDQILGIKFKTGQGNMRLSKQMRIEHDVFKRLNVGEAVMIQKSPAREDLMSLWNQNHL